jgi:hypothetical protein
MHEWQVQLLNKLMTSWKKIMMNKKKSQRKYMWFLD